MGKIKCAVCPECGYTETYIDSPENIKKLADKNKEANSNLTKECDCMKKLIALVLALVCVLGMVGCNNRSMNYIISNEPSITGIVKETNENAILIENEDGEYWVSLNVENKDSVTNFNIGDEIVVYYDGNIAESYPMQINTVYAITLKTPADRTENDKS